MQVISIKFVRYEVSNDSNVRTMRHHHGPDTEVCYRFEPRDSKRIFGSGYAFHGGKGKDTYHCQHASLEINLHKHTAARRCNSCRIRCGIFYSQQSWAALVGE